MALDPKTEDRGHEPDPNLDPRVEAKKMCVLNADLCSSKPCFDTREEIVFQGELFALHEILASCRGAGR